MADLNVDWYGLIDEWQGLQHGQKGSWFSRMEQRSGISRDRFYAEKRQRIGKSKESPKPKNETWKRKRELVKLIIEMKERGKKRSDIPREMDTEVCLDRLVSRGIMQPGELSSSHANTIARQEFLYREGTPRTRWECEHALQEVQTDGSVSKYYRPWKTLPDGDILLKASGRPLRYKGRDEGHTKLILWQYQDKYSRLRIVRGIPGKAESAMIALAAAGFWLNRPEDEHLMRHIPWGFARDNSGFYRGDEWTNFLRALELDPADTEEQRKSEPYEKTGIGSIENRWKQIWKLELVWSEDYPQIKLSEYNQLLHWAMADEQEQAHPYFEGYKGDLYQQSVLSQQPRPRLLDCDVFELACRQYERTVESTLTVSIEGQQYRVPQYWEGLPLWTDRGGRKVTIYKNYRGALVGELKGVFNRQAFELRPFEHRVKGDFGSHKRTYQQRMKDAIAEGNSMYEAIMSGRTVISRDGEYVDDDTGQVITPARPAALMPNQRLEPASPFAGRSGEPEAPEEFDSPYQAKAWIGRQLQAYGLTYRDVAGYFNQKLESQGLGKAWITDEVQKLTQDFEQQQQTKTG